MRRVVGFVIPCEGRRRHDVVEMVEQWRMSSDGVVIRWREGRVKVSCCRGGGIVSEGIRGKVDWKEGGEAGVERGRERKRVEEQ